MQRELVGDERLRKGSDRCKGNRNLENHRANSDRLLDLRT